MSSTYRPLQYGSCDRKLNVDTWLTHSVACGTGVVGMAKKHESATIMPTGLERITRGAAAAISRSAEAIKAHVQRTLRSAA